VSFSAPFTMTVKIVRRENLTQWKWVWACGQDAPTTAAGTAALPKTNGIDDGTHR
jgi:hypothetical protein